MQRAHRISLGLALALHVLACRADGFVNVYEIPHNVSMNVIGNQLTHEIVNRTLHHWDKHAEMTKGQPKPSWARPAQPDAKAAREAKADASTLLAAAVPRGQARLAEAAYKQAYDYHEIVIKKFNLPSDDIGVALASCIAGAWMAYNNKSFPDQFYVPLVQQMRQRLRDNAALQQMSAADRQTAYQTLAITGMLLASSQISWERNPRGAAADELKNRMRMQGGETLTRMLNVPPGQVEVGASGIVIPAAGRQ